MSASKILFAMVGTGTFLIAVFSLLAILIGDLPANDTALFIMVLLLLALWVGVFGGLSFLFKDKVKEIILKLPGSWQIKFFTFALVLALAEEAIAVSLTNLAHFFGGTPGEVFITASTNYFQTIFLASVIIFLPMFWVWMKLLEKYDFKPLEVLILFGITGWMAEAVAFGGGYDLFLIFWIMVYGLMIYLPAYSLPKRKVSRPPGVVYFEAVLFPILAALPIVFLLSFIKDFFDIELLATSL